MRSNCLIAKAQTLFSNSHLYFYNNEMPTNSANQQRKPNLLA